MRAPAAARWWRFHRSRVDRGRGSNHAYGAAQGGSPRSAPACARVWPRAACTSSPSNRDFHRFADDRAHHEEGALGHAEAIAEGVLKAIDRQRDVVYLPGFWALIMLIIKHVPSGFFQATEVLTTMPGTCRAMPALPVT